MSTKLFGILGAIFANVGLAQDIPPQETGAAEVTSRLVDGQLEIRDARDNRAIIIPKPQFTFLSDFPAGIQADVALRSQPTGADLVVTARNTGTAPADMGHFHVGIISLGTSIESFDFRASSEPVHHDWDTYVGPAWKYPNDLYSPVFVLRNSSYAVGISLQYPVMDYKHDAVLLLAPGRNIWAEGEGGPGWFADFWLGHPENTMVQRWATLAAGETRTYVVSIRVTRNPAEWQTTLLPYRNYFRSKYGGVKYQRQTTPIRALQVADKSLLSPTNPFGFAPELRPDQNGWRTTTDWIKNYYSGWPTVILWAPSGLYLNNAARDYPYLFTSHWDATAPLATVFDQSTGLPGLATSRRFGLWWGNSCEVATAWDQSTWENFDPDNADHVRRAFIEMDGAARSGATTVGLDTFMHDLCPVWKSYGWIQTLQTRYPQMRFVTETSSCDILHTICPTFVPGWQWYASRPAPSDPLIIISHPNWLADFLNPGHETWGQLSHQEQLRWFGTQPSQTEVNTDINNFARYGYRVVVCDATAPTSVGAARSWETSVPAAIRDSDPYIADIRAGRLPGSASTSPPPVGGGQQPSGGGGALLPPTFRSQPRQSSNTSTASSMVWRRPQMQITRSSRGRGVIPHYVVQYGQQPQQP